MSTCAYFAHNKKSIQPMTTETPQLNDHKQNCGSASAESKRHAQR